MKLRRPVRLTDIRLDQMDPGDLLHYEHELGALVNDKGRRFDSNETAILTRQIEFVRAKTFEVKRASLLALNYIPLASDVPAWASNVIQVVYDGQGRAQIVANGADDIPRVGVVASEQTLKVVSCAASYAFTLMDLRAALGTGVPLQDKKALMARRVIDTAIDEMLATGSLSSLSGQVNTGLSGFINNAAVPVVTLLAGSWLAATSDAIVADIAAMIVKPSQATKQLFATTDVVMSPEKYDFIAQKRMATGTDTTILSFLKQTNPGVTFSKWHRLTGTINGGTGPGAGGKDRIIAYCKDPEVVEGIVPILFEQLPPQVRNMETSVIVHARCGGVDYHHPSGACYGDPVN
jgi:hypothetical protein